MPAGRVGLPPAYHVSVTTRGPWWTEEDPSLRIPRRSRLPVAIWTVGEGPDLLLLPATSGSHDVWAPMSPRLRHRCTMHVIDRPAAAFGDDVDRLVTAAEAVGARYLAGYAADVGVLTESALRASGVRKVFVLTPPGGAMPPSSDVTVRVDVSTEEAESLTAADASRLIRRLEAEGAEPSSGR